MSIDDRCLVTTRMQVAMNRIRNSISGHGTCGMGVGETRAYWLRYGNDAVKAGDDSDVMEDKMSLMRQRYLQELSDLEVDNGVDMPTLQFIKDPGNWMDDLRIIAHESTIYASRYTIHDGDVYEGHQGVLLDEWFGTHPHTTWSTTHSNDLWTELAATTPHSHIRTIGCVRSYITRHGDGPLRTHSKELSQKMSDPGNPYNPHQKDMRFGYLDVPLLNYAAQVCPIDELALSHLDEFEKFKPPVYSYHPNRKIRHEGLINLKRQEMLTRDLIGFDVHEDYTDIMTTDELIEHLGQHVAPVSIVSHGPAARDRKLVARTPAHA